MGWAGEGGQWNWKAGATGANPSTPTSPAPTYASASKAGLLQDLSTSVY